MVAAPFGVADPRQSSSTYRFLFRQFSGAPEDVCLVDVYPPERSPMDLLKLWRTASGLIEGLMLHLPAGQVRLASTAATGA